MREARDDLPLTLEAPGVTVRTAQWGGMTASFNTLAKGTGDRGWDAHPTSQPWLSVDCRPADRHRVSTDVL